MKDVKPELPDNQLISSNQQQYSMLNQQRNLLLMIDFTYLPMLVECPVTKGEAAKRIRKDSLSNTAAWPAELPAMMSTQGLKCSSWSCWMNRWLVDWLVVGLGWVGRLVGNQ